MQYKPGLYCSIPTSPHLHKSVCVIIIINPRRACAARVTVAGFVCLCVCVSVKPHLTSRASVRPEINVTYSTGNEGQKICGDFSETAPLRRSSTYPIVQLSLVSQFLLCRKNAHVHTTPSRRRRGPARLRSMRRGFALQCYNYCSMTRWCVLAQTIVLRIPNLAEL